MRFVCACLCAVTAAAQSPIRFELHSLPFQVENDEQRGNHVPAAMAGGVAVFDYNNDGRPDIFFTNGANIRTLKKDSPKYSNRLFRNDGNGKFTDVTKEAGLEGTGYDEGVAVADYDNDGYPDIFVAGVYHNTLYHNNGNGTFTDVTHKAGLDKADAEFGPLWSIGAAWVDVNNDGFLDLFVVNYLHWDFNHEPTCGTVGRMYCHPKFFKGSPNQLFLNDGGGTFSDISAASGIRSSVGKGMAAAIADYDGDGRPDIFVTNDGYYNFLFHNIDGKKFEEVAMDAGVSAVEDGRFVSGMGADFRDLNNDGLPDIVYVALDKETFPVYLNKGQGEFDDATSKTGMSKLSWDLDAYGVGLADLDNDGWKDMFVSRGHVNLDPLGTDVINQPNIVFQNVGGKSWRRLVEDAGFTEQSAARHRGCAFADFDGDGRIDVVVTALGREAEVWMNRSPAANHWLDVALQGTKSNRDGVGATIKVTTKSGLQWNHRTTAVSYASSSDTPVHFGLGSDATADRIDVHWPSGIIQTLTGIPADRVLTLKEPVQ